MPIAPGDSWLLPSSELEPALALTLDLEHASMGLMMLRQAGSDVLHPVLGRGLTADQVNRVGVHRSGVGPFGTAAADRRRVTIPDAEGTLELSWLAREAGCRAIEILPLCATEGPALGVVVAMFTEARGDERPSDPEVDLCMKMLVCMLENARLRRRAEQIAQNKVDFLARLSHELRSPLNAITGYLELLRLALTDNLTDEQRVLVERVHKSERVLASVVDDLITFAKLEVGHLQLNIGSVPTGEIIEAAELLIRPVTQARGISLRVHPGNPRLAVRADPARARQILTNLLTNAVKFTQAGGIIRLTCAPEGSNAVRFTVSDTGTGISGDKIDAIFKPYVQAGSPVVEGFGGSGLGLAISHEFANAMHGELAARSVVGEGSTFTLRLPRAEDLSAHSGPAGTQVRRQATSTPRAASPRVAIEPDPGLRPHGSWPRAGGLVGFVRRFEGA